MYCVYKHTTPSNKVYIGITCKEPSVRWGRNGEGYKNNGYFFNAILKYGWDNIKHEILCEGLSKEEAERVEIRLIAEYKSNQREFGYNHAVGGCVNRGFHYKHSKETRTKLSKLLIGNHNMGNQEGEHNNFYGHHHSEEAKRKISESQYHPVLQIDKSGNVVAEYANPYQAELQTGIRHIREVALGMRKSSGGYLWRYTELELKKQMAEADNW